MWRDFTTGLQGAFAEETDTLAKDEKACFYDIRALTVGGSLVGPDNNRRLMRFLRMVRDDQLLEFSSAAECSLPSVQLLALLRHQSNLRCFRARLDVYTAAAEDAWLGTSKLALVVPSVLRFVKTLRIYFSDRSIDGNHEAALHGGEVAYNRVLVQAARQLDCLEMCGWQPLGMPRRRKLGLHGVFEHTASVGFMPGTLQCLVLANLDLLGAEDQLTRMIRLETLSSLRVEYCDRVGCFLRALAIALRRQAKAALKVLTVRTSPYKIAEESNCMMGTLEDLLSSFAGLEELECSFFWAAYVDWKGSLSRHPRLRKLHVSSRLMRDSYSNRAGTIAEILGSCPEVHHFAYQPPTPSLGPIEGCPLPARLADRLYESLDAVAAAPSLFRLRLLYAPGIGEDKRKRDNPAWLAKAAQLAQCLATLILAYLHGKGSSVRLLALSAESRWKQGHGDSAGHFYPHYFYRLQIAEVDGQQVVRAAPLHDYVAECPDVAIYI
jgi:hypothetical protein